MEIYSFVLAAHITAAILSIFYGVIVTRALIKNKAETFSFHVYGLTAFLGFQTITGSVLALISKEVTALSL